MSGTFRFKVKTAQTSDSCSHIKGTVDLYRQQKGSLLQLRLTTHSGNNLALPMKVCSFRLLGFEMTIQVFLDLHPAQRVTQRRPGPQLCLKRCMRSQRALPLASVSVSKGKLMQNACGLWH